MRIAEKLEPKPGRSGACEEGAFSPKRALVEEFAQLVSKWKRDTRHSSSIMKSILHPAYLRIIGLGRPVLPLLLAELRRNPDHWFVALSSVAGTDAAEHTETFGQAVEAWLSWGKKNALIE